MCRPPFAFRLRMARGARVEAGSRACLGRGRRRRGRLLPSWGAAQKHTPKVAKKDDLTTTEALRSPTQARHAPKTPGREWRLCPPAPDSSPKHPNFVVRSSFLATLGVCFCATGAGSGGGWRGGRGGECAARGGARGALAYRGTALPRLGRGGGRGIPAVGVSLSLDAFAEGPGGDAPAPDYLPPGFGFQGLLEPWRRSEADEVPAAPLARRGICGQKGRALRRIRAWPRLRF